MKGFFPSLLIVLVSGIVLSDIYAQVPPPPGEKIGSTRQDSIPEGVMPLDTPVPMSYVLLTNPGQEILQKDTFSWEDIRHYPLPGYYAHLGNYGSATRSLAPVISANQIGFTTGWNQFDPYYIDHETFRYYNQDIPVSKIKYSQGGQEDTYLTLDFGRRFARGLTLSVAYRRINQVGEFAHQRQKDTGFSIGIWHDAPSGKYDAFYNYLNNSAVAQENGGVSDPDSIGNPRWPDLSIPVYLAFNNEDVTGVTTHKHRSFMTKQIFHLLPDTVDFGMDFWIQGEFSTGLFKYSDEDIIESAVDYYGPAYLVDSRGIRQYTFLRENEWSAGIALPWKATHSTINASVRYRGIRLEQEPTERNINEFYLDASGVFQWIEPLILKGDLSLGLGQAVGAFSFITEAALNIGPLGYLKGNWSLISRNPYMVESTLYVNQELIYQTDFANPLMNEVGVSWEWEKQHFTAGIMWLLYDNYIYFDSIAFPRQINGSFSLRRFFVSKDFDFEKVGFRGSLFWQPDAPPELAVPDVWYALSAYGRVNIFNKKVTLMPGVDLNYNGGYSGISYFPVNGQYHLTNGPVIPDAFRIDAAVGLKINFIKFFLRMEDVVGLFKQRVLYQADFYPHYRGYLRLGVEAGFFN